MPHTNAMAYVMISSLSERSLHITELRAGWDTLEIVTVPECKYQTSQTLVYLFLSQNPVSWCELIGRKAEISTVRAGSAAWHKKPNPIHIYKPTVPEAGTTSLSQMIFPSCSAFSLLQGIAVKISLAGRSGLFQLRRSDLRSSVAVARVSTGSSAALKGNWMSSEVPGEHKCWTGWNLSVLVAFFKSSQFLKL